MERNRVIEGLREVRHHLGQDDAAVVDSALELLDEIPAPNVPNWRAFYAPDAKARCIKDNPPMDGFGRSLKAGEVVAINGVCFSGGRYTLAVPAECAFYQLEGYFEPVVADPKPDPCRRYGQCVNLAKSETQPCCGCANHEPEYQDTRDELRQANHQLAATQAEVERLEGEIAEAREAMDWFCQRVEKGEVLSVKTYARFKMLLARNTPAPLDGEPGKG